MKTYDFDKPSARCPICNQKLWEMVWKDGERVKVRRPHGGCTLNFLTTDERGKYQPYRKVQSK